MVDNVNQLAPETLVFPEVATIDTPESSHLAFANKAGVPTVKNSSGTETALGSPTAPLTLTGTTDAVQLKIKQNATQTANPFELEDSAGNDQIIFKPDGGASFNVEENAVDFNVSGANVTVLTVKGSTDNVGIYDSSPDSSANLEVSWSGSKRGVLLPRMTTAQLADIVSPANGLTVYDTDYRTYVAYDSASSAFQGVGAYAADGIPFLDPTIQTWTNLNQSGTFTLDTANRRLHIVADGDGTGDLRGWYTTAPTAPYELRLCVASLLSEATSNGFSVGWRDGTTAELAVMDYFNTAADTPGFRVSKWTNATTVSTTYVAITNTPIVATWFKLVDDNTNRLIYDSADGVAWRLIHTVARTDFLTPDQIFFGAHLVTNGTFDTTVSLLSYEVL